MAQFPEEVLEEILIRLSVKDLIRCRSVSKSWLSVITDPNFVKAHLKNSHHRDRNDDGNGNGNRRIVMSIIPCCYKHRVYERDDIFFDARECHLFGSSNGLVCVSPSRSEILLVNPETREVNKLKNPHIPEIGYFIGGFGYDPSTDDYKVVLGFIRSRGITCFKMFSLKSKVWKVIGDFQYTLVSRVGILCNGALHWVVNRDNNKKAIISFDLSEDKFKEIPQSDDVLFEVGIAGYSSMRLGTLDDRLCAFRREMIPYNIWVMKNYNVKESWELVVDPESKIEYEAVHRLKDLKHYVPNKRSFCHENWIVKSLEFLGSLTYVPSLVSPHVCKKLKRKRPEAGSIRRGKGPDPKELELILRDELCKYPGHKEKLLRTANAF